MSLLLLLAFACPQDVDSAPSSSLVVQSESQLAMGCAALRSNDWNKALRHFEACANLLPESMVSAPYIARSLVFLDRNDEAFGVLEGAVDRGFQDHELLSWEPDLAELRESPRFQALLERMDVGPRRHPDRSPWIVEFSGGVVVPEQLVAHPVLPRVLLVMPDGSVQTFETDSGATLCTWRDRSHPVVSASFSPDGSHLATVSRGGLVCIRDASDGTVRRILLPDATPESPWGSRTLQWSPGGERLLVKTIGAPFTIWSSDDWSLLGSIPGEASTRTVARWNGDGTRIGTIRRDHPLQLWDGTTGEAREIPGQPEVMGSTIDFQRGGKLAAVIRKISIPPAEGGWREVIDIWDLGNGEPLASLTTWGSWGTYPANNIGAWISPDGHHLMGTSGSGFVASWNLESFELEWLSTPYAGIPFSFPAEYVMDGRAILVSGNFVEDSCLMDARTGDRWIELPNKGEGTSVATGDGNTIAALRPDGALDIFDAQVRRKRFSRASFSDGEELVLSPSFFTGGTPGASKHCLLLPRDPEDPPKEADRQRVTYDPRRVQAEAAGAY